MIERSKSLERRLEAECVRYAGSIARLVYYKGTMPQSCEAVADGERIDNVATNEAIVRALYRGTPPPAIPEEAAYWRLIDAGGNCVMQGDGDGKSAAANAA